RLQVIPRLEDPPDGQQAQDHEDQRHAQADTDIQVRYAVEAPAKSTDEIDDRIEQRHLLPELGQHADRVEAAAQEGERRDDQHGHDLQLLETLCPYPEHETEQTE